MKRDAPMTLIMQIGVSWNVTPCGAVNVHRLFGGIAAQYLVSLFPRKMFNRKMHLSCVLLIGRVFRNTCCYCYSVLIQGDSRLFPDQWLTLVTPCVLIRPVGHRETGLFVMKCICPVVPLCIVTSVKQEA